MEIQLPEGVTQKDVEAFIKHFKAQPEPDRPRATKDKYPGYCSMCSFFHSPDEHYSSSYCVISCECPTQVFNHKPPTRFLSKEEAKNATKTK